MASEELNELMLLYVIDGLEPASREWVQRLLDAGDVDAERAYAEAAEAVASLPESLEPITPSPKVLAELIDCAKASDRARADETPAAATEQATAGRLPVTSVDRPGVGEQPAVSAGVWPKLAIAAAFLLGVGLSAVVLLQVLDGTGTPVAGGDWADVEQVMAEQEQALNAQQVELARLRNQLTKLEDAEAIAALQETIEAQRLAVLEQENRLEELQESMSLLVGPGVQQAELAGGEALPNAEGRLMWDPNTGQMRLLTRGLEPLKPGQTYQLWFVTKAGDPISLGVFEVNDVTATTASYVTTAPIVPSNVNIAAISIEPQGGSPQPGPTGPIIMTGPPKGE